MKNSIQYFTENGIPELEKIKMNFMANPEMFDQCVEEVWKVFPSDSMLFNLRMAGRMQHLFGVSA